ncbi:restriction endonuclease subunit S [Companilactobacillus musae]|uniref:restriction endonuclease subunit S n=1 Tax=Companilactobacillus musae TaxID=1903258 RepID=UPI002013BFA6|nr:restriction endonuclease subunit S [Companilactobacillus musae]
MIFITTFCTKTWEQRYLGDLYKKNIEKNKNQFKEDKTISISSMKFNRSGNGAKESSLSNYKVLRIGDIAFEGHKNKEFSFGRFVLNDVGDGIMSPRFTTLRPIYHQNINYWKYYIHNERIMQKVLVRSTKLGTMMNELVVNDFYKQAILVPSSEEQRSIGELLSTIDVIITLQQRQLDLYKKLKKGLLQKLFPKDGEKVPKVRFADFHDDWKQFKLKELGDIQTGNTPSTSDENNYSNNGMMWVTPTDIDSLLISNTSKKLSKLGQSKARIAKRGSVLVTCIASIGKNTLITEDASFNQQINSLTPSSKNNSYFLLTQSSQWSKKMKYIAASGTMQIVNKKDFSNIETYVPSLNEQNEMGLLFKKLDWIIILYQNKINKQKLLKKYLLQNLFI